MTARRKKLLTAAMAVGVALALLLMVGPAFAWMPIHPGYQARPAARAVVLSTDLARVEPGFADIDRIMTGAEELFDLRFHRPVKLFVCFSRAEMARYLPWMFPRPPAAVALMTGGGIYINQDNLERRDADKIDYLKHELTHELMFQNAGLINSARLPTWFNEGTAEYYGGPYYLTQAEFLAQWRGHKFTHEPGSKDLYADLDPQDPKFNYTLYRYFVGYLVRTYGLPEFRSYVRDYLREPGRHQEHFQRHFGVEFGQAIRDFGISLN
jgi:hypothetical protein